MLKTLKKWWLVVLCIIIFFVSIIVVVENIETSEEYLLKSKESVPITQWITYSINGYEQPIDTFLNEIWYNTALLTTEFDTTVSVGDFLGYEMKVNGIPIQPNQTISLKLKELSKTQGIIIELKDMNTGAIRKSYFRTLPDNYTDGQVLSNSPKKGYYYFNSGNSIYKMDTTGQIVFYKILPISGFDFHRTQIGDQIWYSYAERVPANEKYPILQDVDYIQTKNVVMNEFYHVVDEIPFLLREQNMPEYVPLESNQFTILGERHYIISSYLGKKVNNIPTDVEHSAYGTRVVAAVFQEVKDGKLVFQWDSTEHRELYQYSNARDDYFNEQAIWTDYVHLNAITIDPKDQNFLCSFKNQNSIVKINRTSGEIIWILGGKGDQFNLIDDQVFSRQHDVRVTSDGGITIFNNGNDIESSNLPLPEQKGQTSILKFFLNEENRTVLNFEKYEVEKSFSYAQGGAMELASGHFVIAWGLRSSKLASFSEIDFNNKETLFEYISPEQIYRCYKDTK